MATKKTTAPAAKPEEKKVAAEVKTEAPKAAEVKVEAAKTEAPKAAEKKAAPTKKEAAKPAEKKAAPTKKEAAKPAEKKAAPAKKEAAKPAAKKAAPTKKEAAKPAAKKPAAKKVKTITTEDVVTKVEKLIDKSKAKKVDGKVAMDIKLYGAFEGHMYIEIKDGIATVAPYDYVEKDLEAAVSVENALAIADGKLAIKDAIADGRLYINGNLTYVLKLASVLK